MGAPWVRRIGRNLFSQDSHCWFPIGWEANDFLSDGGTDGMAWVFYARWLLTVHCLGVLIFFWSWHDRVHALSHEAAKDKWDFWGLKMSNHQFIKANYPHHGGIWGWEGAADQVVMMVCNIRKPMAECECASGFDIHTLKLTCLLVDSNLSTPLLIDSFIWRPTEDILFGFGHRGVLWLGCQPKYLTLCLVSTWYQLLLECQPI